MIWCKDGWNRAHRRANVSCLYIQLLDQLSHIRELNLRRFQMDNDFLIMRVRHFDLSFRLGCFSGAQISVLSTALCSHVYPRRAEIYILQDLSRFLQRTSFFKD